MHSPSPRGTGHRSAVSSGDESLRSDQEVEVKQSATVGLAVKRHGAIMLLHDAVTTDNSSPVGLVVKNGSNIRRPTSGEISGP